MPPRKRKAPSKRNPAEEKPAEDSDASGDEDLDDSQFRRLSRGKTAASGLVSTFFLPQRGTSTKSIADLNLAIGDETALRNLVASLPERFLNEKAAIKRKLEGQFHRWWSQMRAGYSVLLYGYGSKREILEKFAKTCTGDGACLVVDGYEPRLTARQILQMTAATATFVRPQNYRGISNAAMMSEIAAQGPHRQIYLVIHNIDGPGLRDAPGQRLLSELAALPNVHLAASVDHINAPLLWDLQTKDRFNWLWYHAPTYQPYVEEVAAAAVPPLLVGRKEPCTTQSALVVLSTLPNTGREVFRLIADAQLDPEGPGGVNFVRLFASCRERFLVSNEMLLKSFLTEFRDHDMLVSKRGHDGTDILCVPLEADDLQQVLNGMEGRN